MKITIEYFGSAREAAGVAREVVESAAPMTAVRLLASLAQARGGRLAAACCCSGRPDGGLSPSVLLAVENRQVAAGRESELRDGDEIVVLPPVSGG